MYRTIRSTTSVVIYKSAVIELLEQVDNITVIHGSCFVHGCVSTLQYYDI